MPPTVLRALLAVIYFVSHVYDYLFYPVYWAAHHPWVVRRYNKATHARREDRPSEGCVVFHSLVKPGDKNVELERFVLAPTTVSPGYKVYVLSLTL